MLLESLEGFLSLTERSVAVYLGSGDANVSKARGNVLGSALGAGKDDDRRGLVLLGENGRQQGELRMSGDDDHLLLDALGRGSLSGHLDAQRKLHVLHGQRRDLVRHGCREQKCLSILRDASHDVANLRGEADIEHVISLVEDYDIGIVESRIALLHVIKKSSRSGDDDGRVLLEDAHLLRGRLASDEDDGRDAEARTDARKRLVHLKGKLSGRKDNEATGVPVGEQSLDHRNTEGESLACSRLCDADDVLTLDADRNHLMLNRRRNSELVSIENPKNVRVNAEAVER